MTTRALLWIPPPLLLLAAAPFWEAKPSSEWTPDQVRGLLTNSPWAQMVNGGVNSPAPAVQVYLATAEPIQLAEDCLRAAARVRSGDPSWAEYREYLVENTGKYIVLAVRVINAEAFADNSEVKRMEQESVLRVGQRKYRATGHFPPSSTDPYARLVFAREIQAGDRSLIFELYVPGAGSPYRRAEFALKDLTFHGAPSY